MRTENLSAEQIFIYACIFLAGGLIFLIIRKLFSSVKPSPSQPENPNTMPASLIQSMVNNYRNNQLAAIQNTLRIEDAQSVSFDIRTIKNFISSIEKESSKRNSAINEKDLGIRFYYAAYPEDLSAPDFSVLDKDYAKKHTLIMIPTLNRLDENGNYMDSDFNPLDEATYSENDRKETGGETRMMAMSSNSGGDVLAQNHGNLIPPYTVAVMNY